MWRRYPQIHLTKMVDDTIVMEFGMRCINSILY
jgi:hypothetical protein